MCETNTQAPTHLPPHKHNTSAASHLAYLYDEGNENKSLPVNTVVLTCVKHLTGINVYHQVYITNEVGFLLASPLSNNILPPALKVIFIGQKLTVSFRSRSGLWPNRAFADVHMYCRVGTTVS